MNILGSMGRLNLGDVIGGKRGVMGETLGGFNPMSRMSPFGGDSSSASSCFSSAASPSSFFNVFNADLTKFDVNMDEADSKLEEWEEGWGVNRDPEFKKKQTSPVFRDHGVEAENRLSRIYKTRDGLRRVRTRFGGIEIMTDRPVHTQESSGGMRMNIGRSGNSRSSVQVNISRSAMNTQGKRSGRSNRVEELREDMSSSTETLADLNRQIDDLHKRLPPPDANSATAIIAQEYQGDEPEKPRVLSDEDDGDQDLKGLAGLRSMVLEARKMGQVQRKAGAVAFTNPSAQWVPTGADKRYWGEYEQEGRTMNILVEWKTINAANPPPPHSSFTFKNMVRIKIENLASLLKTPEDLRPQGLRMLNCLGVFRKTNDEEVSYGLVFEVPSQKHRTLLDILKMDAGFVRQSSWMTLARSLSKAVLYLHLARWLHKGIQSSNIMFFPKEDGTIDYNEPYLLGYEYSRQSGKMAMTESMEDDMLSNLYRHPIVQGLPQDTSSPTGHAPPETPGRNLTRQNSGNGGNVPTVGHNRQASGSTPAPLHTRRDRSMSNSRRESPIVPPLLIRRDSIKGHRRRESSFDNPGLTRQNSDRDNKSNFQSIHDIYALGIILLEIGLREPIKKLYDRAMRDPIYGKHFAEKFRQWVLANEVPRLGVMVGDRYQEVVCVCLDDTFEGMGEGELGKAFYTRVVRVLANCSAHM